MNAVARHARVLFVMGPAENDHLAALRVGLSVGVPSLVLLFAGRPDLIIYAVFGAFTGMYGRAEDHQRRLRHQSQAAAMLLTGVSVGVLLSVLHVHSLGLVGIECGLAGLGSLAADRAGLKPTGPFFGLFALGACASVPTAVPPWVAILICAGSAMFSLLVGFAGWARSRRWEPGARRSPGPLRGQRGMTALVHAGSYVVAVGAAGALSTLAGIGHPYWAMAAAAVPLAAADVTSRIHRGIHRIVGTLGGLAVTALILLPWHGPDPIVLAVFVVILQFPTELFITRHYALALVFFTPLILLMTQLANPRDPATLLTDRAVETLLGALVGIAVVLAARPLTPQAEQPLLAQVQP